MIDSKNSLSRKNFPACNTTFNKGNIKPGIGVILLGEFLNKDRSNKAQLTGISRPARFFDIFFFSIVDRRSVNKTHFIQDLIKVNTMAKGNMKNSSRHKEIISAAEELFLSKGYDSTSMHEIAERLGIAKGTIYHYFPSKQRLLEAIVEDIVDGEFTRIQEMMHSSTVINLTAVEKLRLLINRHKHDHENNRILDILKNPDNTRIYSQQLGRYIEKLAPLYTSIFSQGLAEGVFNAEFPLESTEFIIAGIQFLTGTGLYPWSRSQVTRRMKALPFLLEAQLGALTGIFDDPVNNKKSDKPLHTGYKEN